MRYGLSVMRYTHSEGLTQITRISQILYGIFGYPLCVIFKRRWH
ncbi:MAG: hypothetical protein PWP64_947 [Candidatus Cloacimonadota bacterium]|nr:hypothetical protein [Candidatus Cloacimonadota bacterium]